MRIVSVSSHQRQAVCLGSLRPLLFVRIETEEGKSVWAEIAPLLGRSKESVRECQAQLEERKGDFLSVNWTKESCGGELARLFTLPSLLFGLESALLSLCDPLQAYDVPVSAFLWGSSDKILQDAWARKEEGYLSAKVKIGKMKVKEAKTLLDELSSLFSLRVDANRAFSTSEALDLFSSFSPDTFDYVEEPMQDPRDLTLFPHPLGLDESISLFSREELWALPTLKSLVYKPSLGGGFSQAKSFSLLAQERGVQMVLSSSMESEIGLVQIASMAYRLGVTPALGIGTHVCYEEPLCREGLNLSQGRLFVKGALSLVGLDAL